LAWNTAGIFRLVQSIPSARAEPFKRWLAQLGVERMREIEDPEIASERIRAIYRAKGYSDAWIEKRMRSIAIREELAGEWKRRGIKVGVSRDARTRQMIFPEPLHGRLRDSRDRSAEPANRRERHRHCDTGTRSVDRRWQPRCIGER
jgi:hypothetical protein